MRKTIISDLEFGQAIKIALEQTFGRYVWIRLGVKVKCIFFIQKQVKKYRYNFPKFKKIVKVIELLYFGPSVALEERDFIRFYFVQK